MDKKKVLITGGAGLLASASWLQPLSNWDVTLTVRDANRAPHGVPVIVAALEDEAQVRKMMVQVEPDLVIHAAAMSNIEECEKNKYGAHVSNVLASRIVAREAKRAGARLIHISTDHFASGSDKTTEEEVGFPANTYALTKMQAEYEVLEQHPMALVARTNFYTWGLPHRKTFFDNIVESLRSGKEVTLFDDVTFNPLSATQLLKYLELLDEKRAQGTFNVVADDVLTKHQFGLEAARVFGLSTRPVNVGQLAKTPTLTRRPRHLGLSNAKMKRALGICSTPSQGEMLRELMGTETTFKQKIDSAFTNIAPKFIAYGRQSITDLDFEAVLSAVGNSYLTQGPKVEEFERLVADRVGAKYAVAMCNWTAGLHMAVLAAGVGPGDNVITSPITFVASSNCVLYAGATPHFADIDPVTLNLDPDRVEELCKKLGKVKAIIPVHFAGAPCDMKRLRKIADHYGAVLIEDAAHAIGGSYLTGEKIGNNLYSEMVGFSFHPVKNITTGEGGLITTNDEKIHHHLLRLRSHGITKGGDRFVNKALAQTGGKTNPWYYEMQEVGYNYRITDLQCALGVSQLSRLEWMHGRRVHITQKYDAAFRSLGFAKTPQSSTREKSGNHLYVLQVNFQGLGKTRYEVMAALKERGIGAHVHYIPVYRQPIYVEMFNLDPTRFPAAEAYYDSCLTLPVYPTMSDEDVARVIAGVREVIA